MTTRTARATAIGLSALLLLVAALVGPAAAQDSKSEAVAKELVPVLGSEMRYLAAKLPDAPDHFVAALFIPNVQLLVISARYKEPSLLNEMLAKHKYQDVYTDLNSASYTDPKSKVFYEDLRADGLHVRRNENEPFDIYESGGKRIMFDGDFKKQKLSEKEYQDAFAEADASYTKVLTLLLAEAKKGS